MKLIIKGNYKEYVDYTFIYYFRENICTFQDCKQILSQLIINYLLIWQLIYSKIFYVHHVMNLISAITFADEDS